MAREPYYTKPEDGTGGGSDGDTELVRKAILDACTAAGRSIDPSVVARALGGDPSDAVPWRVLIRRIRAAVAALQDQGTIVVLRKGKPVDIRTVKGVFRLGLPQA